MCTVNAIILTGSLLTALILIGTTFGKIHTWFQNKSSKMYRLQTLKKNNVYCAKVSQLVWMDSNS